MLEIVIIVSTISWIIGYFALQFGSCVHFVLVIAVIALAIRILRQGAKPS